ncbi:MAG: hypothetical protein NC182_01730 [Prevotella sp.]|nr:hypothetical protein [Staphylococcus sp.]MCM1349903.1 hypothetical protein [Prevotella sp.]
MIKTIDEYILAELENAMNENNQLKKEIEELKNQLQEIDKTKEITIDEKIDIAKKIIPTTFNYFYLEVVSYYNFSDIENSDFINKEFLKSCLTSDEDLNKFCKAQRKNFSRDPILKIEEGKYNYQINYFGTIVGLDIYRYQGDIKSNSYVIDNKDYYYESYELAYQEGIKKVRSEIEKYFKYTLKEEIV